MPVDQSTMYSYSCVNAMSSLCFAQAQLKKRDMYGKCPMVLLQDRWEWEEQLEELGNIAIYEQVCLSRSLSRSVHTLVMHYTLGALIHFSC